MVKAYYKNSKGEVLWLTRAPFRTVEADWFDSTWEETDSGYEKEITIDVFGKREEFTQNMENLYRVISVDSETGNYGRLYVNDTFLPCQIYKLRSCHGLQSLKRDSIRRSNRLWKVGLTFRLISRLTLLTRSADPVHLRLTILFHLISR